MSWQAGRYDRRITIQRRTRTQSASGAFSDSWSEYITLPATRIINTGGENVSADRRENDYSVTWEAAYYKGVHPNMRVYYDSQEYNILSVIEIGRKEKLRIETQLIQQVYG